MASPRHQHGLAGSSFRRRARHRKGSSLGRPSSSKVADKYGPRRLGALYEISKLMTNFVDTVEQTVLTLLAIINKELPLLSAILIERASDRPITIVSHSPSISAEELRSAEARAMKSFTYLTRTAEPPSGVLKTSPRILMPAPEELSGRTTRGKFITCPLSIQSHRIFGVLHLEGVAAFEEEDIAFVIALGNQLAIALDLHHAHLNEVALRKEAEGSKLQAEREMISRKRVEEEVRKLNEELERRVAKRTAQFQDTIRELHAFTYSIAHDLRAPLRHVHGFSQLLLDTCNDEACKEYARRIMATSEGMDVLIKDLLSYSRLTLDEITRVPVSLSSVLARVNAVLEQELRERKAHLKIEEPLPRVLGHEPSLIQAIANLVSNAAKFAAPGVEPRILVKAEIRGDQARLWVEDNGIGIAPEHHERIFGVFQRLHKVEDYPGTGIGLAIVRRTLERMNGRAGVESRPGRGSRFWIELEKAGDE